jgi:ABC-type sugar transport system permease subunit
VKLILQLPLALFLATLVKQPRKGIGIVRSAIFAPVVTAGTIVAVVWNLMYDPGNGLFNAVLQGFGVPPQPFLTSAGQALPSILIMTIWQDVGLTMLIFLAGLQGIPVEFYDAAAIDGASPLDMLLHITLPLLKRTIFFAAVMTTVFSFQVFAPIYVMTKGGPIDSTMMVVYVMYNQAFSLLRMGYASAMAVLVMVILVAVSLVQGRFLRSEFEY